MWRGHSSLPQLPQRSGRHMLSGLHLESLSPFLLPRSVSCERITRAVDGWQPRPSVGASHSVFPPAKDSVHREVMSSGRKESRAVIREEPKCGSPQPWKVDTFLQILLCVRNAVP